MPPGRRGGWQRATVRTRESGHRSAGPLHRIILVTSVNFGNIGVFAENGLPTETSAHMSPLLGSNEIPGAPTAGSSALGTRYETSAFGAGRGHFVGHGPLV